MRILQMLQLMALSASVVVFVGGEPSGTLESPLPTAPLAFEDDAPNYSERDLFNRAIYDSHGLFVGNVADVVYSPDDGEASLLIVGVGSLPGGVPKDIALNPKALRGAVREQRRALVSDKNRETLLASAAVRFDAASATWIAKDPGPQTTP